MRLLLVLLALALPAKAQEPPGAGRVGLELVLLADASGSITDAEIAFQRRGYAAALATPEVAEALAAAGGVAITYVEWAAHTGTVVPWQVLRTPEDARAFAAALLGPPRRAAGRNAIGGALLDALALMEGNGISGERLVVDFSGDSINNYSGPSIESARETLLFEGVTINALALACRACDVPRPGLAAAYEARLIGGPGAFVVSVEAEESFAETVRRKLVAEILMGALDP